MNAYSGLIRLPQVIELTGLSERTIYRYEGKGYFPKKIKLNPNARNGAVAWLKMDILNWVKGKAAQN